MSLQPRLTLIGMYNYNSTLFDELTLPEGIDKQLFIDNLLMSYGECPLIYTNYNFLKFAIGAWGRKWKDAFAKMLTALEDEYNPLHNFDRFEQYEDAEKTVGVTTDEGEISTSGEADIDRDVDIENTISAFNADDYQPDNKSVTDDGTHSESSSESKSSNTNNSDVDRNLKHTGHLYGNIGVTTSQQMLLAEIDLRSNTNIYDICASIFRREMCLLFW